MGIDVYSILIVVMYIAINKVLSMVRGKPLDFISVVVGMSFIMIGFVIRY